MNVLIAALVHYLLAFAAGLPANIGAMLLYDLAKELVRKRKREKGKPHRETQGKHFRRD